MHKAQFEDLVIMIGGFHLLTTILAIIGSRFADAGLRDVAVQSEIIAEGSVDSVLNGKHYNQAVRLHKIIYEAIARLPVEDFEHSLSENAIEMLNEQKVQLEQLKLNLCQEEIEQIIDSDVFQQWENRFQEHIAGMMQNGSDLAKFWLTYLELCELLLDLINATRTGNWGCNTMDIFLWPAKLCMLSSTIPEWYANILYFRIPIIFFI